MGEDTDLQILDAAEADADASVAVDVIDDVAGDGLPLPEGDEQQTVEERKVALATKDDFDVNQIPTEDLSLQNLNKFMKTHPQLAELAKTDKALHNFLHATTRRSAQLEDYRGVFATAESAKEALGAATDMIEFEQDYADAQGGGPKRVLQRLYEMSLQRDDDGNILTDQQGRFASNGSFEAVIAQIRTDIWAQAEAFLKQKNDEFGLEALSYLKGLYGDGPVTKAKAATGAAAEEEEQQELPADVQRKLAEYDRLVAGEHQRTREGQQQQNQLLRNEMDSSVITDANNIMKRAVESQKIALNPKMQTLLTQDAVKELADRARKDPAYNTMLRTLMRKPQTESTRNEIVKQVRQYAARHLPGLISKQIADATGTVVKAATDKADKLNDQRSKANVKSSGEAPSPSTPSMEEKLAARAKSSGKRRLSDLDVINTILEDDE